MAVWNDDTPVDSDAANTMQAALPTAKADIMDRLRCNNGDFDEHAFFGPGATGAHDTRTGFALVHATTAAMEAAHIAAAYDDGTLHIAKDTASLFVVDDGELVQVSTADHGDLLGLAEAAAHDIFLLSGEADVMEAPLNLTSGGVVQSVDGSASTDAMLDDHAALSWYAAHGADALTTRHFSDGLVTLSKIKHSEITTPLQSPLASLVGGVNVVRLQGFPRSASATGTAVGIEILRSGGVNMGILYYRDSSSIASALELLESST